MQRAMAMKSIWRGAPDRAENMARRTAVVVGPLLGQYTTNVGAESKMEANWCARVLHLWALQMSSWQTSGV